MGLIKTVLNAGKNAFTSTMEDQWKEAIRCPEMGDTILMKKVSTPNKVISNGSTIIVAPGQCALIFDNGKIVDASAEDGIFTWDSSSTPSFFQGQFVPVLKEMVERFTYRGATAKEQFVLYFNIHEIPGATFGTSNPIDFSDWTRPTPNQMVPGTMQPLLVSIKCHGTYTFSINNPILFMEKIAGVADEFRADQLISMNTKWGMQLKQEAVEVFAEVVQELGTPEKPVAVEQIGALRSEIKEIIAERNFRQACEDRGIIITNFTIDTPTLTEESRKDIKNYQLSSNAYQQQATLVSAYAEAVKDAAKNEGGAMNGFMGIGMMNMQTGGTVTGAVQNVWQNTQNSTAAPVQNPIPQNNVAQNETVPASDAWECPNCKKQVTGKFCSECGEKKPEGKFCSKCGNKIVAGAKFCTECGTKVE